MKRRGFTLIELLIFLSIFSVVIISFITIFLSVLRVYSRQSASAEVNRQTQIALQTLQFNIEHSSLIEMPAGISTTTIKLRMPSSSTDPTYIYLSEGTIFLKEGNDGAPQAITNNRVSVSNVSFVRRDNSPGHDSVDINFTMEYVTNNIEHKFVQNLDTAIARVSAATFDSDLVASTSNTYNLGVNTGNWRSINSTIYFNGSNVGVGASTPAAKLQVNSGDIYVDTVGSGIILRSANGICWRVTVGNTGAFTSASTTCP